MFCKRSWFSACVLSFSAPREVFPFLGTYGGLSLLERDAPLAHPCFRRFRRFARGVSFPVLTDLCRFAAVDRQGLPPYSLSVEYHPILLRVALFPPVERLPQVLYMVSH